MSTLIFRHYRSFLFLLILSASAHAFEILPEVATSPRDNPSTPEKISLGKQLYFDPRLSKTATVSCNSCHNAQGSGTDNMQFSNGIEGKKGGRNSPTVWNSAFLTVQFWDGRAPTLEEQAKGPLTNPVEMGMKNHEEVMKRVSKIPGYVTQFKAVFGDNNPLTIDNLAKAIAAYERTLITPNSPHDRYIKGDKKAMPAPALRGMKLVQTVGCMSCHSGVNFAGPPLPAGTGFFMKFPTFPTPEYEVKYEFSKDPGRFVETKKEADKNMWRVASWRNVELTAPYFHNGAVNTLDEAVRVMAKTQLHKTLTENEVNDIVAFLKSLTGVRPEQKAPELPPG